MTVMLNLKNRPLLQILSCSNSICYFLDLCFKDTLNIHLFHCSKYCKCMNQLFMVASSQTCKRCIEGMIQRLQSENRAF